MGSMYCGREVYAIEKVPVSELSAIEQYAMATLIGLALGWIVGLWIVAP